MRVGQGKGVVLGVRRSPRMVEVAGSNPTRSGRDLSLLKLLVNKILVVSRLKDRTSACIVVHVKNSLTV